MPGLYLLAHLVFILLLFVPFNTSSVLSLLKKERKIFLLGHLLMSALKRGWGWQVIQEECLALATHIAKFSKGGINFYLTVPISYDDASVIICIIGRACRLKIYS